MPRDNGRAFAIPRLSLPVYRTPCPTPPRLLRLGNLFKPSSPLGFGPRVRTLAAGLAVRHHHRAVTQGRAVRAQQLLHGATEKHERGKDQHTVCACLMTNFPPSSLQVAAWSLRGRCVRASCFELLSLALRCCNLCMRHVLHYCSRTPNPPPPPGLPPATHLCGAHHARHQQRPTNGSPVSAVSATAATAAVAAAATAVQARRARRRIEGGPGGGRQRGGVRVEHQARAGGGDLRAAGRGGVCSTSSSAWELLP